MGIVLPPELQRAARAVAGWYMRRLPLHLRTEDVVQAALIGAFEALRDFGPQVPLGFARRRARWAVCDYLRQTDWRGQKGCRTLPDVKVVHGADAFPGSATAELPWESRIPDRGASPEERTGDSEAFALALGCLTPLERWIVRAYYGRGHKLRELARTLGYSESSVQKICARAVARMSAALQKESSP